MAFGLLNSCDQGPPAQHFGSDQYIPLVSAVGGGIADHVTFPALRSGHVPRLRRLRVRCHLELWDPMVVIVRHPRLEPSLSLRPHLSVTLATFGSVLMEMIKPYM